MQRWAFLVFPALIGTSFAYSPLEVDIVVDPSIQYQTVDGFGFSEAFGRAENVFGSAGLSKQKQQELLDMLYDVNIGAGFTILRNGIGSANLSDLSNMLSIELNDPGSPSAKPKYMQNNNTAQLPLARAAYSRGLQTLYADSWSAPWFMKNNSDDSAGGYLCGVTGIYCASGNWIQAYVNYLVEYVTLYRQAGVEVTNIGFLNEPQLNTSYASMLSSGRQAAEVIRVLAKTIDSRGLDLNINCCDSYGWVEAEAMLPGLKEGPDPAIDYVAVYTGHGYGSPPNFTLSTTKKVWLSEWADLTGDYLPYTFFQDGGPGEGMTWTSNIQVAFAQANVSAFLYWEGAENATASSSLINIIDNEIVYSKRYWAMAQFSKFIRPGARRIKATTSVEDVFVTAFQNTNGVSAVQVLNNQTSSVDLKFRSTEAAEGVRFTPYLTNNEHNMTVLASAKSGSNGVYKISVPARSLVNIVSQ